MTQQTARLKKTSTALNTVVSSTVVIGNKNFVTQLSE